MSCKLILKSSDGKVFEMEVAAALLSQTIRHMVEDSCTDNGIPIPNVTGDILFKVVDYCEKHAESPAAGDEEYKLWDADFILVDQYTLIGLMLAANYLEIKSPVANMIKGKRPEEIRELFNIKNDFTPEEEEAVRRENQWAFE